MKRIIGIFISFMVIGLTACNCNSSSKNCCAEKEACSEQPCKSVKKEKKTIVCRVSVKAGQEEAFMNVAKVLVEATRQEAGNISYNLYRSPFDPQSFVFYEEYKDDAAFDFHANSEHFKAFAAAIPDMLAAELNIEQF